MQRAFRRLLKTFQCGLGAVLALLGPRAAVAEINLGPPVEVPWLAVALPETVSLAVLEDGSFAIAGTEIEQNDSGGETVRFLVQFFAANGAPEGEPVTVLTGDFAIDGGVGSLGDHYLVTWSRFFQGDTRAAFFADAGMRFGRVLAWPYSAIPTFHRYYRYGRAPTWRFLRTVYYQRGSDRDKDPFFYQPRLQVVDGDAQPLGPAAPLAPGRWIAIADLAINGAGRFVVLSAQCARDLNSAKPCVFGMQVFDGPGQPRTPFLNREVPHEVQGGPAIGRFSIAIAPSGEVALSWVEDLFQPVSRLLARLYDQQGAAISTALPVAEAEAPGPEPLAMRSLDDGNFVLAWSVESLRDRTATLVLRELESGARLPLPAVIAAQGIQGGRWFETNGSGRGIVAWVAQESTPQGPAPKAHFRLVTVGRGTPARTRAVGADP
jgi:hypothetical protein